MGLDAEIIAIGPFARDIAHLLDYPADYYQSTSEDTTVITSLFNCITSRRSNELAEAFGVDAFDFNRHHLNPQAADVDWLRQNFETGEVDRFLTLREKGFSFYYRPNG